MSKIPVSALLNDFQRMYQERWDYVAGGSSERQVDCSGAFVWAFRQHGCKIYHGSNRIARTEVVELIPIKDAHIVPGMAAFKSRAPGLFSGYALPESYLQDGANYNGDINDYYHIGLVDVDTSKVLNAQSSKTGFVSSDIGKGGWTHVAYLKQVDYGATEMVQPPQSGQAEGGSGTATGKPSLNETGQPEGVQSPEGGQGGDRKAPLNGTATGKPSLSIRATVTSKNGKPVKMRAKPSTMCTLYWNLLVGTYVTITGEAQNGWTPIAWGGHTGYMMSEFLIAESAAEDAGTAAGSGETVSGSELSGGESGTQAGEPGNDFGANWAVTIYDLSEDEARELARLYPNAQMFETHG